MRTTRAVALSTHDVPSPWLSDGRVVAVRQKVTDPKWYTPSRSVEAWRGMLPAVTSPGATAQAPTGPTSDAMP